MTWFIKNHIKLGVIALLSGAGMILMLAPSALAQPVNVIMLDAARKIEAEEVKPSVEIKPPPKALPRGADPVSAGIRFKPEVPAVDGALVLQHFVRLPGQVAGLNLYHALLMPEEFKAFQEAAAKAGVKYWTGPSARAAWADVFKSIGTDANAKAALEMSLKAKVQVFDSEAGRQVEKAVPIAEAKALGLKDEDVTAAKILTTDAALPHKFFDGSR